MREAKAEAAYRMSSVEETLVGNAPGITKTV
jgi:hypothetical protein